MFTQNVYAGYPNMTTVIDVTLTQGPSLTGSLDLDSNPTNADIWLDNLYYGTTPQTIGGLSAGTHTLVLRKQVTMITRTVPITAARPAPVPHG